MVVQVETKVALERGAIVADNCDRCDRAQVDGLLTACKERCCEVETERQRGRDAGRERSARLLARVVAAADRLTPMGRVDKTSWLC